MSANTMTAETVQTTQPAFATRAALDAHITAMGHRLNRSETTYTCYLCDGKLEQHDEEGDTVDVNEDLLRPCSEFTSVRYHFGEEPTSEGA